jgi:hypothetical protein
MSLEDLIIILVYSCPLVVHTYYMQCIIWEENVSGQRKGVTASKQLAITLEPKGTYAAMSHTGN